MFIYLWDAKKGDDAPDTFSHIQGMTPWMTLPAFLSWIVVLYLKYGTYDIIPLLRDYKI